MKFTLLTSSYPVARPVFLYNFKIRSVIEKEPRKRHHAVIFTLQKGKSDLFSCSGSNRHRTFTKFSIDTSLLFCRFVNYLLKRYASNGVIIEAEAISPTSSNSIAWGPSKLLKKSRRRLKWERAFDESIVKQVRIELLHNSVKNSKRRQ